MQIILCCGSEGRCVIYGTVSEKPVKGESVTLTDARMIVRWRGRPGGLLDVARLGPGVGSVLSGAVEMVEETVWQEYVKCSEEGAKNLTEWPAEQ